MTNSTLNKMTIYKRVERATRAGMLKRPNRCSKCRDEVRPLVAHHDDYSKPLDVRWLCIKCHAKVHTVPQTRKIRDAKIKAVYESLPEGTTLQQLANMFSTKEKPLSVSSVWYAVYGRKKPVPGL